MEEDSWTWRAWEARAVLVGDVGCGKNATVPRTKLIYAIKHLVSNGEMAELVMAQDCKAHFALDRTQQTLTSDTEGSLNNFLWSNPRGFESHSRHFLLFCPSFLSYCRLR